MNVLIHGSQERVDRYNGKPYLLNRRAITDCRSTEQPSVVEIREHFSAMSAVKGRRWYAEQLLRFQEFPNRRAASAALLENSRRLLRESRSRIVRTKSILAFHRPEHAYVN